MSTSTRKTIFTTIDVLAAATVALTVVLLNPAGAEEAAEPPAVFEVAEDATRFVFDDAPVFDDGLPAYGNSFVTHGYIYEAGTLADGGGVRPDGSPTHPDAVIGTWTCDGIFIGDGAHTESGPWVMTTQIFDFDDFDGDDTIVTHGIEIADVGVEVDRAVVGGTGEHAGVGSRS